MVPPTRWPVFPPEADQSKCFATEPTRVSIWGAFNRATQGHDRRARDSVELAARCQLVLPPAPPALLPLCSLPATAFQLVLLLVAG